MMERKHISAIICSLVATISFAGEPASWRLVALLPENIAGVKADDLEGIYFFDTKFELIKTDTLSQVSATYSDKRFNTSSKIIAGNPFKTYILLPDYNEVITLDKRLQLQARTDLNKLGFMQVTAVTPSADNRALWLYDAIKGEIVAIDERGGILRTTGPVSQYYSTRVMPSEMVERGSKLYIFYEGQGVGLFDDQGVFEKFIPLPGATSISVLGNKILYVDPDGQMEVYDPLTFNTTTVETLGKIKQLASGKQYFLLQDSLGRWGVYSF